MYKYPSSGIFLLWLLTLTACQQDAPPNPPAESLSWQSYHNSVSDVWIEYPTIYRREAEDGDVRFWLKGYPVVSVSFTGREQAQKRGLWARHEPVGEGTLGGRPAQRYVYDHCDGPSCMRTVALVVDYRGMFLALEFRTSNEQFDGVQQRMIESVVLGEG